MRLMVPLFVINLRTEPRLSSLHTPYSSAGMDDAVVSAGCTWEARVGYGTLCCRYTLPTRVVWVGGIYTTVLPIRRALGSQSGLSQPPVSLLVMLFPS